MRPSLELTNSFVADRQEVIAGKTVLVALDRGQQILLVLASLGVGVRRSHRHGKEVEKFCQPAEVLSSDRGPVERCGIPWTESAASSPVSVLRRRKWAGCSENARPKARPCSSRNRS